MDCIVAVQRPSCRGGSSGNFKLLNIIAGSGRSSGSSPAADVLGISGPGIGFLGKVSS